MERPRFGELARWMVESAWGASMPPGSNNPFGIKATFMQPAVESATREVEDGESGHGDGEISEIRLDRSGVRRTRPAAGGQPAVPQRDARLTDNPDAFADALTASTRPTRNMASRSIG